MSASLSKTLQQTIDRELPHLRALTDAEAATSLRSGWTRKQELGHLIDSAANNHLRFVNAALQGSFSGPGYETDQWVDLHGYADMQWTDLTEFWDRYNTLLTRVVERIPDEKLNAICRIADSEPVTLQYVIEDYIRHMRHHLDAILGRG